MWRKISIYKPWKNGFSINIKERVKYFCHTKCRISKVLISFVIKRYFCAINITKFIRYSLLYKNIWCGIHGCGITSANFIAMDPLWIIKWTKISYRIKCLFARLHFKQEHNSITLNLAVLDHVDHLSKFQENRL